MSNPLAQHGNHHGSILNHHVATISPLSVMMGERFFPPPPFDSATVRPVPFTSERVPARLLWVRELASDQEVVLKGSGRILV